MLIGEFTHLIDKKKRLSIPTKLRKDLGERVILTRGIDPCLFVYPVDEWNKIAEKLNSLPVGQSDSRNFVRLMLAGASEAEFDGLGRILIPDYLKEYAQLEQRVTVAGVFNRVEIWSDRNWKKFMERAESDTAHLAEKLGELGMY